VRSQLRRRSEDKSHNYNNSCSSLRRMGKPSGLVLLYPFAFLFFFLSLCVANALAPAYATSQQSGKCRLPEMRVACS